MTIISGAAIEATDCISAPWLTLHDAESQLIAAEQLGDSLAVASARRAVEAARHRCGALWAELLLHATEADGVAQFVAQRMNLLPLVDATARDHAAAVSRAVEDHAGRLHRLAQENWEIGRWLVQLETRIDRLEMEAVNHAT